MIGVLLLCWLLGSVSLAIGVGRSIAWGKETLDPALVGCPGQPDGPPRVLDQVAGTVAPGLDQE